MKIHYLAVLLCILSTSCSEHKEVMSIWQKSLPRVGSQSSPMAADLNGDDILDIIIGAGENEYEKSAQGILAFDGSTGEIIWQAPCKDQIFNSPTLVDINSDNTSDIIIGGRSSQLLGLDGKSGKRVWEYDPTTYSSHPILKYANKNFYNSVLVPDSNGDGLEDILISNGGNHEVFPHVSKGREVGVLLVLDSKTGGVIAADTMPDGGETYMSPIYVEQKNGSKHIVFGTGGETFSGSLYIARLEDLLDNNLSKSKEIATETSHGFISPPVFADVTDDNIFDVIAISHGGTMSAINGESLETIWQYAIPATESSNGLAIGNFTEDHIPDVFTFVSKGKWPWNTGSYQIMLNGHTGELEYIDSVGCPRISSPVVYDLNGDDIDEVIFSLDSFDCQGFTSLPPKNILSSLVSIDFQKRAITHIDRKGGIKNVFSTPLLSDLDGDGYLDIVHANFHHSENLGLLIFDGMYISRMITHTKIVKPIRWGSYMGSNGDGIFR
ncbi:MAG: PQQ-binding-like beta-propeller repeat protein [Saprospiraceae bacterium]|nr:PQQ-binding-like beta-propeller repeat protein [Saprospiraceae bacterium]